MEVIAPYHRLEFEQTPIYVDPEKPDWFVPTAKADFIIGRAKAGEAIAEVALEFSERFGGTVCHAQTLIDKLLSRFNGAPSRPYRGRRHYRTLKDLKECWFHITNQCNMACNHCMFSSDGGTHESLAYNDLVGAVKEAASLGCRVFYLTGGEPFVYKDFTSICDTILSEEAANIVVLTNGKSLRRFNRWLQKAPRERLHFQVSIDGLERNHNALRGNGSYEQLLDSLAFLKSTGFAATLSMAVTSKNVTEMAAIVTIAGQYGIRNIHYLWLFLKGKATQDLFVHPLIIFDELVKAYERGQEKGVLIDNMEILKSQVFSLPGTKFDLSNAAWESIAVGPDGTIYPSPALVGEKGLAAGKLSDGIENVWKNSPVFENVRASSLIEDPKTEDNLLRYFIGGGDIDHSYSAGKVSVGADPYTELYNRILLYLLSREAASYGDNGSSGMVCRMGERLYECDEDSASVGFTHSNCVLSLPGKDGYYLVKSFYTQAAASVNEQISNPVFYAENEISHVPEASRVRSYGCGSPVLNCGLRAGETLVDLGSGAGVECFIAAKHVGPEGKVYGVDMLDEMLAIAEESSKRVAANLGYENVTFRKGFLEKIPIHADTVDVVISNCVINLSPDKRRTFSEIMRILKPGGRMCVSDIICEEDVPLDLKYNEKLRGECIGGAMRADELFALLEDLGFESIYILRRFLYRQVKGYNFYSVTYSAYKHRQYEAQRLIYRGPSAALITDDGYIVRRGIPNHAAIHPHDRFDDSFFILDRDGNVTNVDQEMGCACCSLLPAEQKETIPVLGHKHGSGCMVCGQNVHYLSTNQTANCYYCGNTFQANALCNAGHYVCDQCHAFDALEVIRSVCVQAPENDMIALLQRIRKHAAITMHGPEHHSLVPGIILSVYKNVAGSIADEGILTGIERGRSVAGGACSFLGVCGAATGVGIAFAIILGANPYSGKERQLVMQVTKEVMDRIAAYEAPRCCQRESLIALKAASELSEKYAAIHLPADSRMRCMQHRSNKECIGKLCPLWNDASYRGRLALL